MLNITQICAVVRCRLPVITIAIATALPAIAGGQGVPGGKAAGAYHTEAIAHRARVRNQIANLLAELGDRWDRDKPGEVARLYSSNGTIVLGPLNSIQGRDEIRKALTGSLRQMRGVMFTMEEYDLSGDLRTSGGRCGMSCFTEATTALAGTRDVHDVAEAEVGRLADRLAHYRGDARPSPGSCGGE